MLFLVLFTGVWFLPDYGITIDEPLHFMSGRLNATYFRHGPEAIEAHHNLRYYGPFSDMIGYYSFLYWYHIAGISPLEARHIHLILFFAGAVFLLYHIACAWWPPSAALGSALLFAATPRIAGHVPVNPKSIPYFFWSLLLVFCVQKRLLTGRIRWSALSGCVAGLCFATRIHAVLIIMSLCLWVAILGIRRQKADPADPPAAGWRDLIVFIIVMPAATCLVWPWLRYHPLTGWLELFTFFSAHPKPGYVLYLGRMFEIGRTPWHYAPVYFLITTPLAILLPALAGWIALWRNPEPSRQRPLILLSLWLVFTVLPFSLPGSVVYDGPRHLLPAYPPLVLLAGYGLHRLIRWMRSRLHGVWAVCRFAPAVILAVHLAAVLYLYHPYQMVYYNCLVGGVRGAAGRFEIWSWGHSIKEAIESVNKIAAPNARVFVYYPRGLAKYYLRPDLRISETAPDFIVTTAFREPERIPPEYEPVGTVAVRGVILNTIWAKRYDPGSPVDG